MDLLVKDVRFGARMLLKNPASSTIAVVALALGIGLTAMMFSIIHGAIFKGLPFAGADQLVYLSRTNTVEGSNRMSFTIHDFDDYRAQQQSFTDMAAYYTGTVNVSAIDKPERFDGAFIMPEAFSLLGVQPHLGRVMLPEDGRPGAPHVMLLSYPVWQDQFGGDPDVVGRVVRANARPTEIIGVMPPGFAFPVAEQVWVPLNVHATTLQRGQGMMVNVFARLRDGITIDQAMVDLNAIAQRLETEYPETNRNIRASAVPFIRGFIGDEPVKMLYTALGAVFMVLLIACANVANLLISRAAARNREVGIRTAMGASGVRIVRQFLTEAIILSVVGGVIGLGIAWTGIRLFNQAIAPTDPPFWIDIALHGDVLLFVLAITLLASVLAGGIPAWQATRANVADVLKDESRGASSFRLGRISRALVITEIALSAGLLVGAGLMIRSVMNLRTAEYPFATADVFTARVGLPEAQYSDAETQRRFFEELLPRLRARPEIESVGLIQALPGVGSSRTRFAVEGAQYEEDHEMPLTRNALASPDVFAALSVGLQQGRVFTEQDREGSLPVAIVTESLARRYFDGDPLGRRIRLGGRNSEAEWLTIVGVLPDLYRVREADDVAHAVYVPFAQSNARFMSVIARTRGGDAMALAQPVREAVLGVDTDLPIYFVQTLRKAIDAENWFYMIFGSLFMTFGGAALFLAAVGLYGVMATSVSQRTREMGVRMALGAERRDVLGLVMKQGLLQLVIGLVLGLGLAVGVSNLLQMLLFEVNPRDPLTFGGIVLVLTAAATAACLVPARRATRVDPMHALRYD